MFSAFSVRQQANSAAINPAQFLQLVADGSNRIRETYLWKTMPYPRKVSVAGWALYSTSSDPLLVQINQLQWQLFHSLTLVWVSTVAYSFGAECWVWMTQVSLYSVSSCNRMNITVGWTSCGGTSLRGSVRRLKPWRTSTGFCWRMFYPPT